MISLNLRLHNFNCVPVRVSTTIVLVDKEGPVPCTSYCKGVLCVKAFRLWGTFRKKRGYDDSYDRTFQLFITLAYDPMGSQQQGSTVRQSDSVGLTIYQIINPKASRLHSGHYGTGMV